MNVQADPRQLHQHAWRLGIAWITVGSIGLTVVFLIARRSAGAFSTHDRLTDSIAFLAMLTPIALARLPIAHSGRFSLFDPRAMIATVVALMLAALFSNRDSWTVFYWATLMVEELLTWRIIWRMERHRVASEVSAGENGQNPSQVSLQARSSDSLLTQLVERGNSPNGAEFIRAQLRGRFDDNDRALQLHVGFCPPLGSIPKVNVEQLDGPQVQIQIGHCQIYGVRLDLRRSGTEPNPCDVLVAITAQENV